MSAAATDIATLNQVPEQAEETAWISPIGQSIDDCIAEEERLDPKYKKLREKPRPYFNLTQVILIRRDELEITQRELARRSGLNRKVVSRLEREEQEPTADIVRRLSRALELDVTPFLPTAIEGAA